jgi:hypothetical protein
VTLYGLPGPLVLVLAIVVPGIVVLMYTIRWRLPQRIVSTTALWLQVTARKRGSGRLGMLEHLYSLFLQLMIAGALVMASGLPRFSCQSPGDSRVVMVLDRSPSMAAIERIEPRLDIAKRQAHARLRATAATDMVGLVLAGGDPELVVPVGRDRAAVRQAIAEVGVRTAAGHLDRAVALACRLLEGASRAMLVVVTDGSEPYDGCPHASLETIGVGKTSSNIGITAFEIGIAPRDPRHAEAYVEIANEAGAVARAELRVTLDGSLVAVARLELQPGQVERHVFGSIPVGRAGKLVARLTQIAIEGGGTDALNDDNVAYAVVTRPQTIPVDLIGDNPPLQMVLQANPRYAIAARRAPMGTAGAVTVISGPVTAPLGPGAYLLVDSSGPGLPITVGDVVANPRITYWHDEHPILRHAVLSDLLVGQARMVRLPASASALVGAGATPLVFAMAEDRRRIVGLNFELETSNLPLRVGFPVLIYDAIDWLLQGGAGEADPFAVPASGPVVVSAPGGRSYRVEPSLGRARVVPSDPGFYEVATTDGRKLATFAVSVSDRGETAIAPRAAGAATRRAVAMAAGRLRDQEVSRWLLVLVLALLLVEWITYHRRITV